MELCDTQEVLEYSGIVRTVGDKVCVYCYCTSASCFWGLLTRSRYASCSGSIKFSLPVTKHSRGN